MTRRGIAAVLGLVALATPGAAHAQPNAYDAEQASIDFADSKFDVACKYFVDADRIQPSDDFQAVKHAIDQLACYVRAGLGEKADRSRSLLDAYYAGKPEPEAGKAPAHYKARYREYVAALDKNGPRLVVELPAGVTVDAITVTRAGATSPIGGDFKAPRFVDAGRFHVSVKSGADTYEADATVENPFADGKLDRETAAIVVRPTKKPAGPGPDPDPDPDPKKVPDPKPVPEPPGSAAPGIALLVSGGIVAVVGGVLLGVAGAKAGEIPDSCDGDSLTCANDADTLAANDASEIGQPLLGAGIAGLAVGASAAVVGAILLATRSPGAPASAMVAPWIDRRTIGLVVGGAW